MTAIRATYHLSEADFMKACEAHWRAMRQGSLSATLIGLGAVLLGAAVAWRFPRGLTHTLALTIVGVGGLFPAIIIARYFIWRKTYRDARKFQDSLSIEFTDEIIHVASAAGASDLNWSAYHRYLETEEFYMLYMAKHVFSVIPKKAFSPEDRNRLERLFRQKLPPPGH